MGRTIELKTIDEVLGLVKELEPDAPSGRLRSNFLFRGLSNDSYHLESSLQRNCGSIWKDLEGPMLRNFFKYAIQDNPYINKKSVWENMIVGQHHGLPTRLLDWSYSPLIGLHFATLESDLKNMDRHGCVLWKMDINEIHSCLPEDIYSFLEKEKAYIFTVEMMNQLFDEENKNSFSASLDRYDEKMGENSFMIIEPPSIDPRIINQYSYFSVIPKGIENFEDFLLDKTINSVKYIIPKDLRWEIRDVLDRSNINERIAYPGLEGLSLWLKRHYYHSDNENT